MNVVTPTTVEFAGIIYTTSGWVETVFRVILWLAALGPDPFPRCVEVKVTDLRRFPPEAACNAEAAFWARRACGVGEQLARNAGPWGREMRLDLEEAGWMKRAWGHLADAHFAARHRARVPDALRHLGHYKDMVGDGLYVTGWFPQQRSGK
jgi:hypothetical protein